ncbi:MAG: LysR family transcriptional regulator [Clostridia bacterium]|nr:LysR family transcriptional regulator [Clostridia bacterium]
MNTKILEYIIGIAQEHSISRAADKFYLTQPVLTRHLKKVEEKYGTPLFTRQKDGMMLTEAGRIYINSAKNILHLESELDADLQAMLEAEKSSIHLYADYYYAKMLSEHVIPLYQTKYPEVHIRLSQAWPEEIQISLSSGETGIGILVFRGKRFSGLEYVTLHSDSLVLLKPDTAEHLDTVFVQPEGTIMRNTEERFMEQNGITFRTILEAPSFRTGLEGVKTGQGCAFMPRDMAEQAGFSSLEDVPASSFQVCVVYPKNMVFRPASRALLQSIISLIHDRQ